MYDYEVWGGNPDGCGGGRLDVFKTYTAAVTAALKFKAAGYRAVMVTGIQGEPVLWQVPA